MFSVEFAPEAQKRYKKLGVPHKKKVAKAIYYLQEQPYRGRNITRLGGKLCGLFRYRIDPYRIIYKEDLQTVVIVTFIHRGKGYRTINL